MTAFLPSSSIPDLPLSGPWVVGGTGWLAGRRRRAGLPVIGVAAGGVQALADLRVNEPTTPPGLFDSIVGGVTGDFFGG